MNTFSRCPPCTVSKNFKNIENKFQEHGEQTLFSGNKSKTRFLSEDVKIRHYGHVYKGFLLYCPQKLQEYRERTLFSGVNELCFLGKTIKTRSLSKNFQKRPHKHVYQGSPPIYCLQKIKKHREQTQFLGKTIKTRFLAKDVKLRPHEHVNKGSLLYCPQKTPKT